jgi:hypothetical protein
MVREKLCSALLSAWLAITMLFGEASFSLAQGQADAEATIEEDPLQQPLPPGIRVRAFIHRPRVLEPNHLGTCTPTADDTVADYGFAGWHLPASGITWKLNESTVPARVGASAARMAISDSFATWSAADPQKIFIDGGKTAVKAAKLDGKNAILWKRLGASTIGVTYVWYKTTTHEVAEVDTVFNNRYRWRIFSGTDDCSTEFDAYDLQNIATHEFGHWVGLDDLFNDANKDLTMYGFGAGGELKKRSLGTGDIDGANAVAP